MPGIEKRAHFRRSLQADAAIADVTGDGWNQVQLLDISRSGVALISKEALEAGLSRALRFSLPDSAKRINVVGKVAHCTPHTYLGGYRVGIQFSRIHEDDITLIEQFVSDAALPAM